MRGLVWLHTVMSITRALVIHNEMYMKNVLITGYKHIFKYFTILKHDHPPPFFFSQKPKYSKFTCFDLSPNFTIPYLFRIEPLLASWLFVIIWCGRLPPFNFPQDFKKETICFSKCNPLTPPIKLKDVFPLMYHSIKYLHAM